MIPRTIYLLQVWQEGSITTLRAYASNGPTSKLGKVLKRLDRYYATKVAFPSLTLNDAEFNEQEALYNAWRDKHPIHADYATSTRIDFFVQTMQLR